MQCILFSSKTQCLLTMTDEPRRTMYIARATQVLEKVDEKKIRPIG